MNILIIGATGMLGKPVAKALLSSAHHVSLMARDTAKMKQLFPHANIVSGDVFDKQTLLHAFTGIDAIYINLSVLQNSREKNLQPERDGIKNIIEAAKEKQVKKLFYLSSLIKNYQGINGFSWWAFDIKQKAVDAIRASGLQYTIFYPSTFMETFPNQMIKGSNIMMPGKSIAPMWFIAAEDYAKQVARSFDKNGNNEYVIQGTDPYTFDEAAKVFKENYRHKKLKIMHAPIGLVKFFGNFSQVMNYGARICEALNKYPEKFEGEKAWQDLGKPTITLQQYASSL